MSLPANIPTLTLPSGISTISGFPTSFPTNLPPINNPDLLSGLNQTVQVLTTAIRAIENQAGIQGISIPGVGISVGSDSAVVRGLLQIGADLINSIVENPQIQVYKRERVRWLQ